ncbi:hypothetical protein llg_30840 [Luteolibacter sp. LG18]|nr:hypothetical protein llg_30840 [Luteolibacter sp. LG18]
MPSTTTGAAEKAVVKVTDFHVPVFGWERVKDPDWYFGAATALAVRPTDNRDTRTTPRRPVKG